MKYQGDQAIEVPENRGLRSKIKPSYLIGAAIWVIVLGLGVAAVLYEPGPEPRGSISIGSVDAPVTIVEFSDFQ